MQRLLAPTGASVKTALSRRTLLQGAAAALAAPAVIPAGALGADGQAAPSERVTLGHIGVGGQGGHLFGQFRRCQGCQSVAVADCFQARRESRATAIQGKAYRDFRELLARKDIDGVVIATQDHWHVPAALLAVRAGKDVYVEKPVGISVLHDQTLRKEVRALKRIFQYGTQQRSQNPHCRRGCELVRNGKIGKITEIHVTAPNGAAGGSTQEIPVPPDLDYDMWLGPAPKAPYTKDRCTCNGTYHIYDYAIGFIAGWGAHPLDQLVWGYDIHKAGVTEVEGTGRIPTEGLYNTVLDWDVKLTFANGLKMTFKPGGDNTKFVGTEGWISVARGQWNAEPVSLKEASLGPNDVRLVESRNHYQNFVDCIKSRKDPVSHIEDAVRSDIISHLGDIAIRLKRKIRWDWDKEEILGDPEASKMLSRPLRAPWTL
jgi:glucose-fructose oxidoreductase